jgi:hypothetical protein
MASVWFVYSSQSETHSHICQWLASNPIFSTPESTRVWTNVHEIDMIPETGDLGAGSLSGVCRDQSHCSQLLRVGVGTVQRMAFSPNMARDNDEFVS